MMVTCPWCGTNYQNFQSNCDRCGGPLALPSAAAAPAAGSLYTPPTPPPAPRPVAPSYAVKLMWSDGTGVVGLVFLILGAVFSVVGGALTVGVITAFVGLPFLLLGLVFLVVGGGLAAARYQAAKRTVDVLRLGDAAPGKIARVEQNLAVRVNNQHPWNIWYHFQAQGQSFEGKVSTFNPPGPALQPGQPATVLYSPLAPQHNSLYPHP